MKNPNLRILISVTLFSLISGIIVTILGIMLGWKTSTQFSDGFSGPVPSSSQSVL
jgi:hypothetical protein